MSAGTRALLFGVLILVSAGVGGLAAVALALANGIPASGIQELVTNPQLEHIELLKWMNNISQLSTFFITSGFLSHDFWSSKCI
jgi:hypothetical protein